MQKNYKELKVWQKSYQHIAYGSNCELETQILLSGDLGYVEVEDMKKLHEGVKEVERMLKALIKSLEDEGSRGRRTGVKASKGQESRSQAAEGSSEKLSNPRPLDPLDPRTL